MMPFYIIVIGASAGGRDALCKLAATFPPDLNAAIFIVLHISPESTDHFLINKLQKYTPLPCLLAIEALPVKPGRIYIAPANHHISIT